MTDEVTITRTHKWDDKKEAALAAKIRLFNLGEIPREVIAILGGSRNLHMLRIYVPRDAVLLQSSDPEVTPNFDMETKLNYFSAKMDVPVNQSKTLKIRYSLPFKLDLKPVDKYAFAIQKQAGFDRAIIQKRVFPSVGVSNFKYFPATGGVDLSGVLNYQAQLNSDLEFSSVWGN
jgi:hypothetical protein